MKNKKGSVLVFALIILSFILVAAFSTASIALIERRSANTSVNSATAFQKSDKGMEMFLQQLYKNLDQKDTLNELASQLDYECYGANSSGGITTGGPARIGNKDTEFIITAYKDVKDDDPNSTKTEWESVKAITDCSEPLANVARFRATGNHNNAARAVFLKLRDSLTRGLVAHWSFEDRAQNASNAVQGEDPDSVLAMDSSKNDYTLTLCNIKSPDEVTVKVEGNDDNLYVVNFNNNNCKYDDENGMDSFKYDDGNGNCVSDEQCTPDGRWRDGVVQEGSATGGLGPAVNAKSESIYFNGNDYLTALTDEGDCKDNQCEITVNYVNSDSTERLDLETGISISAWFKRDDVNDSGTILSKMSADDDFSGYRLTVDEDEVCFYLGSNSQEKIKCETIDGMQFNNVDNWNHLVVSWRKKDGDMEIFLNGEKFDDNPLVFDDEIGTNDIPLAIGVILNEDGGPVSSSYFKGSIDDVRIWNRALTNYEAERLCNDGLGLAAGLPNFPTCQPVGTADEL